MIAVETGIRILSFNFLVENNSVIVAVMLVTNNSLIDADDTSNIIK